MRRQNRHDTKEFKEEAMSLALHSPSKGARVKYGFITEHRSEFSIVLLCGVLGVSKSSYDDHHKQRYGSPRITKALRVQNESCSQSPVARRVKVMNLKV